MAHVGSESALAGSTITCSAPADAGAAAATAAATASASAVRGAVLAPVLPLLLVTGCCCSRLALPCCCRGVPQRRAWHTLHRAATAALCHWLHPGGLQRAADMLAPSPARRRRWRHAAIDQIRRSGV